MPKVSIIIPVFNHAKELVETLACLRKQTFQDFEVIVVDDQSTDGIQEVVNKEQENGTLKFYQLPQHSGAPRARNEGFAHSSGDYLLFLDADAILVPDGLEVMVEALEKHPNFAFCYSSFVFGWKRFQGISFDIERLKKQNYIHTSSLVRREAFPGFDEALIKFQDWDLWLTISERGGKGYFIDRFLISFKERKTGYSTWLPKFVYRLPWPLFGWTPPTIQRYRVAEKIIRDKHHL